MSARSVPLSPSIPTEKTGSARQIRVDDKDISRFRSIVSAPLKGLAKGTLETAQMIQLLSEPWRFLLPQSEQGDFYQKAEEYIEKKIPTHPEFLESSLERGAKLAVPALLGGAGASSFLRPAIGSAIGGFTGQATEEAGGGPFLQALAEIAPQSAPSLAKKIIPSSADQKRILDVGRKYGMSEQQLAPLMPETGKKRFFGKFAFAGEKAGEKVLESKKGVQNIYDILESSPEAKKFLPQNDLNSFVTEVNRLSQKMPHAVRSQLKNDALDLVKSARQKGGLSGEDLMNFYHDVSSRYNIGRSELELFKNPIKKALTAIDPTLGHEFEVANRMYQKAIQVGRILKPGQFEHLISLGEAYELGASVASLDMGRLQRLLGLVGFRKFSEKMLTSPRLQNMIEKTQEAVMQNNLPMLKKTIELIEGEIKEKD